MYNIGNRVVGIAEFENAVKMEQKLAGTDTPTTICAAHEFPESANLE